MKKRLLLSIIVILGLLMCLPVAFISGQDSYQSSLQQNAVQGWTHPNVSMPQGNSSLAPVAAEYLSLTVILGTHDVFANRTLVNEGWTPSCISFCFAGIKYAEDPTVHVVNGGIDCIGFKVHGTAHGTTCPIKGNVTYTMVSSSSGHSPAFTDTSCPATVATTNGFSIASGTYVAGTPSSGSSTDTLSYTWTASTSATSAIDLACISWTNTNSANTLYAAGQIGSTTVNVADTLETIWSITYASS